MYLKVDYHQEDITEFQLRVERLLENNFKPMKLPDDPIMAAIKAGVGQSFRCYACQQQKPQKDFGGMVSRRRVCRSCFKLMSEVDVGTMVKFDRNHGLEMES